jgi:ABC-type multidrug transport system ATPase subunit
VARGLQSLTPLYSDILVSRALFLDEISTGLDSATLYNIVNTLKRVTAAYRYNTVVSLLQPPPEVFNLFDDLILMAKG